MSRKHGLLIYTAADAERNKWFIAQLCHHAESEGLSLRLCLSDEAAPEQIITPDIDFVINRSRLGRYSICAQNRQIPCFNSADVTCTTNDKYQTYLKFCGQHGIPMADTWYIRKNDPLPVKSVPLIAKPADGHGGSGVVLLQNTASLKQYTETAPRPYLLQAPMKSGWDMRIYILGGEIYSAVLRTSETDFRSNFSLGGRAEIAEPDNDMRTLVQQIQNIMPLDFAGIDFLRHPDGGYVLGEIEDAVGCRMLYQLTDKDPAWDFIRYICDQIK